MNSYEQKLANRQYRLRVRAERIEAEANSTHRRSRSYIEHIPFGQPILVGHHSEKRHRNAIKKSWDALGKAVALTEKAERLRYRASRVGKAGISSDDPEGIDKLKAKVAKLEAEQAQMKAANAAWRKAGNKPGRQADGTWQDGPYARYELTNNNANIRRIKQRIAHLERQKAEAAAVEAATGEPMREHEYPNGIRIVENFEANRLQVFFPGKPAEAIRKELKQSGFRWSPSEGAWQRHLGTSALWNAQRIVGAKE